MIRIKHIWDENGDFEKAYYVKVKENISRKNIKKHFYILNENGDLDDEKLKKLLLSPLEEIFEDEKFVLIKNVCDLAYHLKNEEIDITFVRSKLNEIRDNKENWVKLEKLFKKSKDATICDIDKIINNNRRNHSNMIRELNARFKNKDTKKNKENNEVRHCFKNLREEIGKIFDYEFIKTRTGNLKKEANIYGYKLRDTILEKLNVGVCPYCNRNYVDTFEDKEEDKKIRSNASLDHFLNKSTYPFLALSLYNFIPSCSVCNSRFKGYKNKEIINPYFEEYGEDCKFKINFKSAEEVIGINQNLEIKLNINESAKNDLKTKISNSNKLFRIESIYQNHGKQASEILEKKQRYTDKYINDIYNLLIKSDPNLTKEKIKSDIFGIEEKENFIEMPLSKFKSDIYEQINNKYNI